MIIITPVYRVKYVQSETDDVGMVYVDITRDLCPYADRS